MKMHKIASFGGPDKVFTACGREGWQTGVVGEFETACDVRFDATEKETAVTCQLCLKAIARATT